MAHVQQMARSQAAALDVVAGHRAMRVGMAADQHEGHAARGQFGQQRIGAGVRAAVRIAQDQAIHAPRQLMSISLRCLSGWSWVLETKVR